MPRTHPIPSPFLLPSLMAHAFNPGTWKAEAGESELKASLGGPTMKSSQNKQNQIHFTLFVCMQVAVDVGGALDPLALT